MFKIDKYNEEGKQYTKYYDSKVLNSGQTIKIEFHQDWSKSKYYYSIYLVIMDKRKSEYNTYLKTTGMDGLKGLMWAKEKIIEFESFIKEKHKNIPVIIYCQWDDKRRRNIYERGLRNLDYKFNMVFGKKVLCKILK